MSFGPCRYILFLMRLRLPYFIVCLFLFLFFLPFYSFAQSPTVTPIPTCSEDFWKKVAGVPDNIGAFINGLFIQDIPESLKRINQSKLPYGIFRGGENNNNICQESNAKSAVDIAKDYQLARANRFNDGNISVTANLSFFDLLWANTIGGIFNKGNKEADNFLRQGLPKEAAENILTAKEYSPSSNDLAGEKDARVLGIFGSKGQEMAAALPALQCANLPYGVGNCAVTGYPSFSETPSIVSPSVSPSVILPSPGNVTPTGGSVGICPLGVGDCSVENLKKPEYFGSEEKARLASQICAAESNSNPLIINDGCLEGKSRDYSIGLFQINLLAHCPEGIEDNWNKDKDKDGMPDRSCRIIDEDKFKICKDKYLKADENIKKAKELSGDGTNWSGNWSTAAGCRIP